jgi:hypothetical protein
MTTWLQHVKKVHAAGSTSFKESLKRASASWKKTKASKADSSGDAKAPKKKRRARKKKKKCTDCEEKDSIEQPAAAPKKKRRRAKKVMPKLSGKAFKSIDSINM